MKEKFQTFRGKRGMDVKSIKDKNVRFVMQVLACNMLRKGCKYEVPVAVISSLEQCVEGV
jgi:hypothetical protein